jgi:hypothetical protein
MYDFPRPDIPNLVHFLVVDAVLSMRVGDGAAKPVHARASSCANPSKFRSWLDYEQSQAGLYLVRGRAVPVGL